MGMLAEMKLAYRASLKRRDIAWNTYVARPLATVLVVLLRGTRITPNQVSIVGLAIFVAMLIPLWKADPVWGRDPSVEGISLSWSLIFSVFMVEFAYLFDCADGQLARLKGMTSEVGAYFDFLIDEVKALVLMAGFGVRIWLESGSLMGLVVGLIGAVTVSIATSLTQFVRRKEYTGGLEIKPGASANVADRPRGGVKMVVWGIRRLLSFVIHYPSWIWLLPGIDLLMQWIGMGSSRLLILGNWQWQVAIPLSGSLVFVLLYLGVYLIYLAKTGGEVLLRLGSSRFYTDKS